MKRFSLFPSCFRRRQGGSLILLVALSAGSVLMTSCTTEEGAIAGALAGAAIGGIVGHSHEKARDRHYRSHRRGYQNHGGYYDGGGYYEGYRDRGPYRRSSYGYADPYCY